MASATHVEGRTRTYTAGSGGVEQFRRVKLSAGTVIYCDDNDTDCIGVTWGPAAAGEPVSVILRTAQGTVVHTATASAIAAGVGVYAAADGKVAGSGTVLVGLSQSAIGSAGGYIEVLEATNTAWGEVARASLTQDDLQPYTVPVELFRVHDALQTSLPTTAAADDLGLIPGTYGTAAPKIQTLDFKNTTTTAYARVRFVVPVEYVAGQTITLRVNAGMTTTVASSACTLDATVYRAAAPSTDICATAAQSINSLTAANTDFTITPTDVVPGDVLDIRLVITGTDSATGTAVLGTINSVALLADVKG